jgi:predicted Rossmann fold nucleotide-binding protein DprA/Smf involved in DNA uptake
MSRPPDTTRTQPPAELALPSRARQRLGDTAPAALAARGEPALLQRPLLAVFCSATVPAATMLGMLDAARRLAAAGVATIGGFHSPLEREALGFLLRGGGPVVVAEAREIATRRVPAAWAEPLRRRRLLQLSGSRPSVRRPTRSHAAQRNRLAVALAEAVFIAHAVPGGSLFPLAREALGWDMPVYCLDDVCNADLVLLGVRPLPPSRLDESLPLVRATP